jgi:hypothetical protein
VRSSIYKKIKKKILIKVSLDSSAHHPLINLNLFPPLEHQVARSSFGGVVDLVDK